MWETVNNIKAYYNKDGKGIHHIDVEIVQYNQNNTYKNVHKTYKGHNVCCDIIDKFIKRSGMKTEELIKIGKLAYLEYYDEKEHNDNSLPDRNRLIGALNSSNDNVKNNFRISNLKVNKKLIALLVAGSLLVVGVNKAISGDKKNVGEMIKYYNPDKSYEMNYDKIVHNNYEQARSIFERILYRTGDVSSNDIDFITNYFTYASMTNSDYNKNDTYTEYRMVSDLIDASKGRRSDIASQDIQSILMNIMLDYNSIFRNGYQSDRCVFNEKLAYHYFVYVISLINGGEDTDECHSKYYDETIKIATKNASQAFRMEMTPLERIIIYTQLKGLLQGDYDFKYLHESLLYCYDLSKYNKDELMSLLDSKIMEEKEALKGEFVPKYRRNR